MLANYFPEFSQQNKPPKNEYIFPIFSFHLCKCHLHLNFVLRICFFLPRLFSDLWAWVITIQNCTISFLKKWFYLTIYDVFFFSNKAIICYIVYWLRLFFELVNNFYKYKIRVIILPRKHQC